MSSSITTPILIKRYANRKLYNTEESKYINLSDIDDMVRAEIPVQIIDNKSGEDVTRRMLAQMMVETEKKSTKRNPYDFLHRVLHAGADPMKDVVSKLNIDQGKEIVDTLRDDVESEVQKWIKKGEVTRDEVRHFFDNWQQTVETASTNTESTVTNWFDKLVSKVQSNEMMNRINELEKRIEILEKTRS